MFTGIIEAFGRVESLEKEGDNLHLTLASDLAPELKIDQSLAHNGVC
ncbi:MAG: riboflavin synthase, partial [Flavobacteriaceae bacterium]